MALLPAADQRVAHASRSGRVSEPVEQTGREGCVAAALVDEDRRDEDLEDWPAVHLQGGHWRPSASQPDAFDVATK